MAIIEVKDLQKVFRVHKQQDGVLGALSGLFHRTIEDRKAVDGVSFAVEAGEIVGYVGPNGAGKSTTIKCLTGILVPSGGQVSVGGLDPWIHRVKNARQIGVVFGQKTALWWDVPVIETFRLLRDIYEVPDDRFRKNLALFDDILGIGEFQTMPVRQLSLGQRMRADLAAALLHNPKILFLDEPTIGLDVLAKERLRTFIREINRTDQITVLLTTHDMGDIEMLCHRIMIIDRGKVIHQGSISETIHHFAPESTAVVDLAQIPDGPVRVEGGVVVQVDGLRHWIRFRRDRITAADLVDRLMRKYPIRDFTLQEPSIEEIVRGIYDRPCEQVTASGA